MKVSSPVGDLPFEVKRLRWKDGTFVVEGAMGAWPARVVIYPKDATRLAHLLRWPLIIGGAIVLVLIVLAA